MFHFWNTGQKWVYFEEHQSTAAVIARGFPLETRRSDLEYVAGRLYTERNACLSDWNDDASLEILMTKLEKCKTSIYTLVCL